MSISSSNSSQKLAKAILVAAVLLLVGCAGPEQIPSPQPTQVAPPTATSRPAELAPRYIQPSPSPMTTPAPLPSPTALATPPKWPSSEQTIEAQLRQTPPSRDLYELRRRLMRETQQPNPLPRVENPKVGDRQTFWVADHDKKGYLQVQAVLRHITPDLYFFVEQGREVPEDIIRGSAVTFSQLIAPRLREYFGSEWPPEASGDRRIVILHALYPGPPGYYSSGDEYPRSINPYSNERKMIYVNLRGAVLGSRGYYSTLAHEFQHMIHWNNDVAEDAWVNEGLSELATRLAGYPVGSLPAFTSSIDTQLNTWDEDSNRALPHYGAAYAFFSYFAERYGGYQALRALVNEKKHGGQGIDEFLRGQGYGVSFEDAFKDWVIANLLDNPDLADGRYGYRDLDVRFAPQSLPELPFRTSATVHQYAADYLDLSSVAGELDVVFTGTQRVKLVPNEPYSGKAQWWSNRGDVMDTTLTREFDLAGLDRATLKARLWFDIEEHFDYAYVEASTDGGQTWNILPGKHTTRQNPNGNSFGPAYTGKSGGEGSPSWIEEELDLTPYAGRRTLIRFEYITDDANNNHGFVVDDVRIPELGYTYDAETDGGWVSEGFVRSENYVRQNYVVQLVQLSQKPTVETLPLDSEAKGHWRLKGSDLADRQMVLVVAATAPSTTVEAQYELSVEERPGPN